MGTSWSLSRHVACVRCPAGCIGCPRGRWYGERAEEGWWMEDTRRDPSRIETARHSVGISYISRSYPSTSEQHKRGRRKHAQRGNTLIADAGPGDDLGLEIGTLARSQPCVAPTAAATSALQASARPSARPHLRHSSAASIGLTRGPMSWDSCTACHEARRFYLPSPSYH